ncbi:MAG TPA: DUF3500 domain-containing protein [Terriglobales bacterium]|nr:DUF3500 domain-containing protein [Terriglobales bacterium]
MCMKRRSFLRSSAALVGVGVMHPVLSHADESHPHVHAVSLMSECANRLLAALDANQRGKATFPFDTDERKSWHYVPANTHTAIDSLDERKGLQLREMTPYQKHLASALLAAGLSQTGYIKAVTIMSMEDVLKLMENDSGERRNPEKYYFSLFGTPSDKGTWGYRIEGHHISQNYTVVNGKVISGPSFFGSNPAEVRQGPRKGLRPLALEDDLGLELIRALDEPQQKIAIVDPTGYQDILTKASRKAALQGQASGLSAAKMNARQFDALMSLVEEYAHNVPDELAAARITQMNQAGKNVHFAWSGGISAGDPHYYRVQTPSFLIEFDDTQDGANHIHSVWRDFNGDFGEDLLQRHYQDSH